jgi:hypothetical protein
MNDKILSTIDTFLQNYTCTETEPGYWEGSFTNTRKLHTERDNLNDAHWEAIARFTNLGFDKMPKNLRVSAEIKFDAFEQWQVDMDVEGYTFPQILKHFNKTRYHRDAQQKVWGVLVSCIEATWWGLQDD